MGIQTFYFERSIRNRRVAARRLTWQMAGARRSSRLSLAVRWSVPVPIVSPRCCPPRTIPVTASGTWFGSRRLLSATFGLLSRKLKSSSSPPSYRKRGHASTRLFFFSLINVARKKKREKSPHSLYRKSEENLSGWLGSTNRRWCWGWWWRWRDEPEDLLASSGCWQLIFPQNIVFWGFF